MMNKILVALAWLLMGLNVGLAQSETIIKPGGAIYDVATGAYLGTTNYKTGAEEWLVNTLGSGLSATAVVCTSAAKALTSTCTSATPSFGATTVTTLNGHTFTAGSSTFTGTAAQTYTFPTTSATIARTDAGQTFTGTQAFSDGTRTFNVLARTADAGGLRAGYDVAVNTAHVLNLAGDLSGGSVSGGVGIAFFSISAGSWYEAVKVRNAAGAATTATLNLMPDGGTVAMGGAATITGVATLTGGLKGSTTNDTPTAGNVGELITATVASGSAVSLTTATSANITSVSLTGGDWDCSAQVTHNAAATTSITLLQIGISATTATLPTQAGGSGIGTDPLAIYRTAAMVPAGALTTNVGPVRVSLSGTTTIYLVANDTFTVSTLTGYGTLRCRRMR